MSQDRVELVRVLAERWNSGERDFAKLADFFDPAIELESPLASVAGEPYRGYPGMERWAQDFDEHFAEWSVSLDGVRRVGSQVIAIGTINARGQASEIALQLPSATVSQFSSDGQSIQQRRSHHANTDLSEYQRGP
jgi:hypothetical protein